jgi:hypothetical protein
MSSLVPGPTDTGRCPVVQRSWFRHAHERSSECVVSAGQAGDRRVDATTGRPSRLRGRPFRVCPSGDGCRPARAASPPGPCAGRRPPGRCPARSGSVDQSRLRRSEAGRGGRRCRGREHRSASRTRGRVRSGRISVRLRLRLRLRLRFGRSGVRVRCMRGRAGRRRGLDHEPGRRELEGSVGGGMVFECRAMDQRVRAGVRRAGDPLLSGVPDDPR